MHRDLRRASELVVQRDIFHAAWDACDAFRSAVDTEYFTDYIFAMFFLKYISDVWNESCDQSRMESLDGVVPGHSYLAGVRFIVPENANFNFLFENRSEPGIGNLMNTALQLIEQANKESLGGVLQNIDFDSDENLGEAKERNDRLKSLLEDFNQPELDMRTSRISNDEVGNVFIFLIERFASDSRGGMGEFYTPQKVSELVGKLSEPKAGARICDPACGSGGLLIETAKAMNDLNHSLWGMEVDRRAWALCRMNMFIHGEESARIELCDSLASPTLVEGNRLMKFDNVVSNPPSYLDEWEAEKAEQDTYKRFERGVPYDRTRASYAFISHMIEAAAEKKGRVTVVVPHGVLFRGWKEGPIRKKLITENLLDAVIGLPGNLISFTRIQIAILIFDRSREEGGVNEDRKNVLFIDASRENYRLGKFQNMLLDEHIEKILKAYKERKVIKKFTYLASLEELEENDFNLNISHYVNSFEEEGDIDIQELRGEIDQLEIELEEVRGKMDQYLNFENHGKTGEEE